MVVYKVECQGCGKELEIEKVYLDSGDDLCVAVSRCEVCWEEARQEGFGLGARGSVARGNSTFNK